MLWIQGLARDLHEEAMPRAGQFSMSLDTRAEGQPLAGLPTRVAGVRILLASEKVRAQRSTGYCTAGVAFQYRK
jgi:hypothetical protein